jgi:hypothetical protein
VGSAPCEVIVEVMGVLPRNNMLETARDHAQQEAVADHRGVVDELQTGVPATDRRPVRIRLKRFKTPRKDYDVTTN